jgi:protein TonB
MPVIREGSTMTMGWMRAMWVKRRSAAVSVAVHFAVLALLLGGWRMAPKMAPYRLPGTPTGTRYLTYLSSGNKSPSAIDAPATEVKVKTATETKRDPLKTSSAVATPSVHSDAGTGDSTKSGMGDGDIDIALQQYFPYPKPDLTSLPHGTGGDVILNAVIDEHGKIKELTLLKGLGDSIDRTVMATVQRWSYTPAKKNGVPVPSEQELHFHYERG